MLRVFTNVIRRKKRSGNRKSSNKKNEKTQECFFVSVFHVSLTFFQLVFNAFVLQRYCVCFVCSNFVCRVFILILLLLAARELHGVFFKPITFSNLFFSLSIYLLSHTVCVTDIACMINIYNHSLNEKNELNGRTHILNVSGSETIAEKLSRV